MCVSQKCTLGCSRLFQRKAQNQPLYLFSGSLCICLQSLSILSTRGIESEMSWEVNKNLFNVLAFTVGRKAVLDYSIEGICVLFSPPSPCSIITHIFLCVNASKYCRKYIKMSCSIYYHRINMNSFKIILFYFNCPVLFDFLIFYDL